MSVDAATCGLTLVEENLARTLADCAQFRTWVGAGDQAGALAKIYFDGLPAPPGNRDAYEPAEIIALRPFAIIETGRQGGYSKGRVATETYAEAGRLNIVFEENVAAADASDIAATERKFKNILGTIVDQMLVLAYQATYLAIDMITFSGPIRCLKDDIPGEGDHHFAFFDVQHGMGVRG